jgi:hypothetical protein
VRLVAGEDVGHRVEAGLLVDEGLELGLQFLQQRVVLGAGLDDALRLAPFEDDVDAAEAELVGLGMAPVDVDEEVALVEEVLQALGRRSGRSNT